MQFFTNMIPFKKTIQLINCDGKYLLLIIIAILEEYIVFISSPPNLLNHNHHENKNLQAKDIFYISPPYRVSFPLVIQIS